MKFARYLEENAVDEWRKAYIDYRGLKKLIKRVDAHYKARMAEEARNQPLERPPAVHSRAKNFFRRGANALRQDNSFVPNYGSTEEQPMLDDIPPVTLDGTNLRLPGAPTNNSATDVEAHGSHTPQSSFDARRKSGVSGSPLSIGSEDAHVLSTQQQDTEPTDSTTPITWVARDPKAGTQDIDELISKHFDAEEQKFFLALDEEADRIVTFYKERESEAFDRLSTLVTQLIELAEHRREFKAQTQKLVSSQGVSRIFSSLPRTMKAEEVKRARLNAQHINRSLSPSDQIDTGDKRRAKAMEHVQALNIGPLKNIKPEEHASEAAHIGHDPVKYKAARKKLRTAVIENHRGLEILNNYRILNRTGFTKILKKFDKTLDVEFLQPYYEARVVPTPLVQSETVPKLLQATKEIFTMYFEHGDEKRARELLREPFGTFSGLREHRYHSSTFRTGLYLGVALCAIIQGLRDVLRPEVQAVMPNWKALLQVYSAELIPTLFALLFGLNLVGWQKVRINTVFIFEWDARNVLDPAQYFEIPSFFLLLLSIFFWISFSEPQATTIRPDTWPLVWLVIVVLAFLNPFPVFYPSSRRWFLASMTRVFTGGVLYPVEFRDFFLGDELNSLMYTFGNLWYLGCEYDHHFRVPDQCPTNGSWWFPVLAALPAFLRFLQCFRRYFDSRRLVRIHLVNAGKYASSVLNVFMYFNYRRLGSPSGVPFAFWILFAAINSVFTCSWDFVMDWNLLQRNAKYPLLRSNLAFADIWPAYYVAMVTNFFGRCNWVIYLFGGPASLALRAFLAALIEMLRRWQWNFIRLENEHLGNADSFKIVRDLPLPYPTSSSRMKHETEEDDDGDSDGQSSSSFRLRPRSKYSKRSEQALRDNEENAHQTLQRTRDGLQEARRRNGHD
ncbi:Xenotropic and polytropic retrovirus receptor 1 [Malassezia yamatoensis]|uniref:Xenotropic and polytropic retrovirus receptor 1 n=1 Tax=Malassezia yamatoensis TaxID=253288 RepID=A0AAJ6CF80_9BASI|nr:Xenotropic and polytropic retrovirus receptor 1 [Malassezia yamatoensis]